MLHVRRASVRLLLFVIIGLASSVVIGTAATVKYQSDAELIANASRVVRARVLSTRSERGPGGRIYTITTLEVLEDFSGENDSIIEVRELGGLVGNEFLWVGGIVRYAPGSENRRLPRTVLRRVAAQHRHGLLEVRRRAHG